MILIHFVFLCCNVSTAIVLDSAECKKKLFRTAMRRSNQPGSSAAFATAALAFRTASCALGIASICASIYPSLPLYCNTKLRPYIQEHASVKVRRRWSCGLRASILCHHLCTVVRAYTQPSGVHPKKLRVFSRLLSRVSRRYMARLVISRSSAAARLTRIASRGESHKRYRLYCKLS